MRMVLWGVRGLLVAASLSGAPAFAEGRDDEAVGTSCADCPNYEGMFTIANKTGTSIRYQVRWGNRHKWQPMQLPAGHTMKHRYPLGENPHAKVPSPSVRYDNMADGNRVTWTETPMKFHAVGYAGFGPTVNRTKPKPYHFEFARDGRQLTLYPD